MLAPRRSIHTDRLGCRRPRYASFGADDYFHAEVFDYLAAAVADYLQRRAIAQEPRYVLLDDVLPFERFDPFGPPEYRPGFPDDYHTGFPEDEDGPCLDRAME
jgi:hypothetical protein